jgi:histidinol-phosphate aminotransferase
MTKPFSTSRFGRRIGLLAIILAVSSSLRADTAPVRLTLNENPYGPSPLVVPALKNDLAQLHRYVGDEASALAAQIAKKEGVAPEQIVLGDVLEGLGLYLSLQGGPGGEFIFSVPGYPALVNAAASVGGVVVAVPLNAKLENDLPAIAAKVTARTRAVFLVNPHNPSGTVNSGADFAAFVLTVAPHALVVVDEAYLEYSDDYAGRTAAGFTSGGQNVIVFRTFSKVYGLAALPLSYAVAPKPVADFLRKQGLGDLHSLNRLALTAAAASLRDEKYIARVHDAVAQERTRWNAVLDELKLRHTDSQANFVYFDAGRPHAEVAAALSAEGVIVGRAFPPYADWVRITIGLPDENARAQKALQSLFASIK